MTPLTERHAQSRAALDALPAGEAAWFWATAPCEDGLPFFLLVPQDADPSGKKLSRRAQWLADQQAPAFTARGVVRRLQSGLLTLSTDAPLEGVGALYAGLCRRGPMPDLLAMRLGEGQLAGTRLLQDLQPLSETVRAMAPGESRWFTLAATGRPDRLQLAADRAELDAGAPVRGQLRRDDGGDFQLRVDAEKGRELAAGLQQWGRQAAPWPDLMALSAARVVTRTPKARRTA